MTGQDFAFCFSLGRARAEILPSHSGRVRAWKIRLLKNFNSDRLQRATGAHSAVNSALDRRTRVRGLFGETPPCALMTLGAWKIRIGCNILKVPIQIITSGERVSYFLHGESKLWWHVSGSSLGIRPRPSAIALCVTLIRR